MRCLAEGNAQVAFPVNNVNVREEQPPTVPLLSLRASIGADARLGIYTSSKNPRRVKTEGSTPSSGSSQLGMFSPHYFSSLSGTDNADLAQLWQGPSSALSFFDLCQAAILGPEHFHPEMSRGRRAQPEPLSPMSEDEVYTIPPNGELLITKFISVPLQGLGVFHEPTLLADYQTLATNLQAGVRPKPVQLALYNVVFAITTVLFADVFGSPNGQTAHEVFHNRMRNLMHLETQRQGAHTPSLMAVQTLLWEVMYLTTQAPLMERGEMQSLNLAAHYAISLGLHIEPDASMDALIAETRRRTYWCLRNCATHVGCLVGGTSFTNAVNYTVALPTDFPDQQGSPAAIYLRYSATLHNIYAKILDQLYHAEQQRPKSKELRIVLDLEDELQDWKDALPRHFQIDGIATLSPLQQLLRLRYCLGRLMLMRPSLTRLLTSSPMAVVNNGNNGRLDSIAWQGAESLALEAAIELIDAAGLCSANRIYRCNMMFNTDYIFIAMTVLLASRFHQPFPSFDTYWGKAVDIIQPHVPMAAERLQLLAGHLEARTQMQHHPAQDLLGQLLQQIWAGEPLPLPNRAQSW